MGASAEQNRVQSCADVTSHTKAWEGVAALEIKPCCPPARSAMKPGCKKHQNEALLKPWTAPLHLTAQNQLFKSCLAPFSAESQVRPCNTQTARTGLSLVAAGGLPLPGEQPKLPFPPSLLPKGTPPGTQHVSAASPGHQLQREFFWRGLCTSEGVPCPTGAPSGSWVEPSCASCSTRKAVEIIAYPKDGE